MDESDDYTLTESQCEERVLAERERCAKIADYHASIQMVQEDAEIIKPIAAAIRSGK